MKEPWEWKEADLQALVDNKRKEGTDIEYKSCPALSKSDEKKKDEISKDVSAFANAAGGVLVYGIVDQDYLPIRVDDGYDPLEITREWLEQIITTRIKPRIDGLKINQVDLANGNVVYVVSIPQSMRGPHQANDKRYHKRHGTTTLAMEDYEVRDVRNRAIGPDLELHIQQIDFKPTDNVLRFRVFIRNLSPVPAEYVLVQLGLDCRMEVRVPPNNLTPEKRLTEVDDAKVYVDQYTLFAGLPSRTPIFQGYDFPLITSCMVALNPYSTKYFLVYWEIISPNMTMKRDFLVFSVNDKNLQIFQSNHYKKALADETPR